MLRRQDLAAEGKHDGFTARPQVTPMLGLLAAPLAADAQPAAKVPRIGYLTQRSGPGPREEAFQTAEPRAQGPSAT